MNLIVIDSCTNSCPYCFAEGEMSRNRTNSMSMETFNKVLQKIRKTSSPVSVNLLGGEPLLHPKINDFVNRLENEDNVSSCVVLTGGVVQLAAFNGFSPDSNKISFLFNVNRKDDYKTDLAYNLVHKNIARLVDNGFKVSLGFNIYRLDFDPDEILSYCKRYGISALRLAVAKPTFGLSNPNLLLPIYFDKLSTRIADFVEKAANLNIKVNIDCMLPKCFFNDADIARVIKAQPDILNKVFGQCGIALDITPQEEVFRCFATEGMHKRALDDFNNFDEMADYFIDIFDKSSHFPDIFDKCQTCKYSYDNSCKGDCYSNWRNFSEENSYSSKISEIYNALENQNLEIAYELLLHINQNSPAVSFLWAYYWAACQKQEEALSAARRVIISTQDKELIENAKDFIANQKSEDTSSLD